MYISHRHLIFTVMVALCVAFALHPVPSLWAAGALQTVVDECKKRTGFGDSTCLTLVKKYMNVDRCQEYTGNSREECAQKIEEIKKDPEFSSGGGVSPSVTPPAVRPASPALGQVPALVLGNNRSLAGLRERKERELTALWQRTEAIATYLKGRGADIQAVEAAFPEFERRAAALLAAYDTYRAAYEGTAKDNASTKQSVRTGARNAVDQAMNNLTEYYRTSILTPLRLAYEKTL